MEKGKPNRNAVFTVPLQEPEHEETAAPMPPDNEKKDGGDEKKKHRKKLIIGASAAALVLLTAVLMIVLISRGGENENHSTPAPAFTDAPTYHANGFSVDEIRARLLDRTYISAFPGEDDTARRISYYETVFNVPENDTTYDLFAAPASLGEIPVEALKRSELVLCFHYTQNADSSDAIEGKLILNGGSFGAAEKEFSLNRLYDVGQIFVGLDELVPDASLWQVGSYRLSLMLDGLTAYTCSFELVSSSTLN